MVRLIPKSALSDITPQHLPDRAIIAALLCALRQHEAAALADGRRSGRFTPEPTVAARHANTPELSVWCSRSPTVRHGASGGCLAQSIRRPMRRGLRIARRRPRTDAQRIARRLGGHPHAGGRGDGQRAARARTGRRHAQTLPTPRGHHDHQGYAGPRWRRSQWALFGRIHAVGDGCRTFLRVRRLELYSPCFQRP